MRGGFGFSDPGGASRSVVFCQLGGPQKQVVAQKLHNQSRILVVFVLHAVQVSNCLIESSTGHSTCLLRVLEDFIMEDGMVESESQFKRVCVAERLLGVALGLFVGTKSSLCDGRSLVGSREFSDVTQEVGLHFEEKDLGLVTDGVGHQGVLEQVKDVLANACQFSLNLLLVVLNLLYVFRVALDILLLLDGREDTPRCSAGANHILESHCQDVPLLKGKLLGT